MSNFSLTESVCLNWTEDISDPLEFRNNFDSTSDPLQKFYDQMAYESLLEFGLTIVASLFGAFDFVCKVGSLLWDVSLEQSLIYLLLLGV